MLCRISDISNSNKMDLAQSTKNLEKLVRLKEWQIHEIQKAFVASFEKTDHLWLFGSRVNLTKKGGDIDLFIETSKELDSITTARSNFHTALMVALGEQKIDIVIKFDQTNLLIHKIAKEQGVLLV